MLFTSVDASHDFLMPLNKAASRAARGSELLNCILGHWDYPLRH